MIPLILLLLLLILRLLLIRLLLNLLLHLLRLCLSIFSSASSVSPLRVKFRPLYGHMAMDRETIEALEIVSNRRSQSMDCSLLGVLDKVGKQGRQHGDNKGDN